MRRLLAFLMLSATVASSHAAAQAPFAAAAPTYADLADLALAAPIVADVEVKRAARLKGAAAAGVAPAHARFYIEGSVLALISGSGGLPGEVRWLADVPLDAKGRAPKLKRTRLLLLASTGARPGELRLVAPNAQIAWNAEVDARLRAVLAALVAPDAPPRVTGVGSAFHVPGSLPGESETQIFLATADGRPVSLAILRRPGEQPRWAVALGEMVDEAAAPPARDTLLWYRLACTLPPQLPGSSSASLAPAEAAAAAADYRLVVEALGPCTRSAAAQ